MTKQITLDHGSGGRASHELIQRTFFPFFNNSLLAEMNDSAVFETDGKRLAFTTDSFTVSPIIFNGGDIGSLAIHGTVNDLAMCGAKPIYLSVGFIIEEGLSFEILEMILSSMKKAIAEADVLVITGDTKVVPKGQVDKIFINTSGIGIIKQNCNISGKNAKVDDLIIINGTIGDHGMAILSQREGINFETAIKSDTAPLNKIVEKILANTNGIHVMRDPTRGGVATSLNEIAMQSKVGIEIWEEALPFSANVLGAAEILGIDPLYLANEGKFLIFIKKNQAKKVLDVLHSHPYGKGANVIGEVKSEPKGKVWVRTKIGGKHLLDMLIGEPLPRIC